MQLRDYLAREGMAPEEFARRIKVDPVSVHRYLRGVRRPKWIVVERITKATAGEVTANDFVAAEPARRSTKARAVAA